MRRSLVGLVVLIMCSLVVQSYVMTENQIQEDIKFLSQTSNGIKPSRLRALLLADLHRALLKTPETNCTTDADLKVTPHCTCTDYSCERLTNHGKRSRIQRSCEDFCCRRSNLIRKSINSATYDDRCEFSQVYKKKKQLEMSTSGGSLKLVPFIVQIFSSKSKTPICLGSLIHPQIVMTTLVCASMQMNERMRIKVREMVDKYQYRYQVRNVTKRIIPDNYSDQFEKFGFNIALLVLNNDIELSHEIRPTCLPQPIANDKEVLQKCYVDSLENKNGRILEKRSSVTIYPAEQCQSRYKEQNRSMMFFSKSSICAGHLDEQNIGVSLNGAPLFCVYESSDGDYQRYVQHGMLSWSTAINQAPHLFVNVSNFRNWIEKNLKVLELA